MLAHKKLGNFRSDLKAMILATTDKSNQAVYAKWMKMMDRENAPSYSE